MKPSGAAADVLLLSEQGRSRPGDNEAFYERAVRINAPEGLQQAGNLIEVWNPLTDTLAIHRARILRGTEVIDLLASGRKYTVLRRETDLEAAMIDGRLTATLQPEGLRVGDVLDVAYTITRNEPALAGHSEGGALAAHAGAIGRLSVSAAWPAGSPFRFWKTDDLPVMTPVTRNGWTEIAFEQSGAVSPEPPQGAPAGDQLFGVLETGDFLDWNAVSATAYPLYARAATLSAGSPLNAEIARIRAADPSLKARALAALELVENQTRYLYVGLDAGGYTPARADVTWTRRFGDCKGKTVLLLALLKGLGVEAEPALVSTTAGDGLDRRLPQMGAFDHVMVRATIGGKVYWLDATRLGDENLDVIDVPNFHWALPVREKGADLEPIAPTAPSLPMIESVLKIDGRAGLEKPAAVHEEIVMRGTVGWAFGIAMRSASHTDSDRALRRALTSDRSWITPDRVGFTYDPQTSVARATLDGTARLPFTSADESANGPKDWLIEGSEIGYDANLARTSDYHRTAPYAAPYPSYTRVIVEVRLPGGGKDFEPMNGESISRTVGGVDYSRAADIVDGQLNMVANTRAVAQSFPASDAAAVEAGLRSLAGYQVSVRYTPPHVAAATATSAAIGASAGAPTENAADKATDDLLHKSYGAAELGFTQALATRPTATLYYRRAVARAAEGKDALAQEDLKAALGLDPKDAYAEFGLGRYALRRGDAGGAASRFRAAEADSVKPDDMLRIISFAYQEAGRFAEAYAYEDRLLAKAVEPKARASALNTSCWLRAEAGRDLAHARDLCDASLALDPGRAAVLDSRGLVELRMGTYDKAAADYTSALAKAPTLATSLYGRSIAEAKLGEAAQAEADLTQARVMDPKVEGMFAGWGVSR